MSSFRGLNNNSNNDNNNNNDNRNNNNNNNNNNNPFDAEATFVLSTRAGRILKTTSTLSCWYSLDIALCSHLSTHAPQGLSHFSAFKHHFVLAKLATTSIRDNNDNDNDYFPSHIIHVPARFSPASIRLR